MIKIPKPLIYISVFGTVCGGAYLIKYVITYYLLIIILLLQYPLLYAQVYLGINLPYHCYFFRDVLSGKDYKIKTSASNKVIIITGANTGLGKEAARLLAIKNATVVMACRDLEKCEKVNANIIMY